MSLLQPFYETQCATKRTAKQQQNILTGSMALKRCVINRAPAAMPNSPSDKLAIEWPTIRLSHHNMSYSICVYSSFDFSFSLSKIALIGPHYLTVYCYF